MRKVWRWAAVLALVVVATLLLFPAVALAADGASPPDLDATGVVALIATVGTCAAVVNGMKKQFNLAGQKLMFLSAFVGVGLQGIAYFVGGGDLDARQLVGRAVLGAVYGLTASGFYVYRRGGIAVVKQLK